MEQGQGTLHRDRGDRDTQSGDRGDMGQGQEWQGHSTGTQVAVTHGARTEGTLHGDRGGRHTQSWDRSDMEQGQGGRETWSKDRGEVAGTHGAGQE